MSDDDLLTLADAEIRQLRSELAAAVAEARNSTRVVEALAAENAGLYRQLLALQPPPAVLPLSGLRIGIIGHPSREADYRAVIERLGGQLLFAEAQNKLGLLDRVVQRCHGTLYLTQWGNHKASQRAGDAARRYDRPLVFSDQPGLAAVERAVLEELVPQICPGTR
jgi:hypothetical protein